MKAPFVELAPSMDGSSEMKIKTPSDFPLNAGIEELPLRRYSARSSASAIVDSTRENISLGNLCATLSSTFPSFPKIASDSISDSMYTKESASGLVGAGFDIGAVVEVVGDSLLRMPRSLRSMGGSLGFVDRSLIKRSCRVE